MSTIFTHDLVWRPRRTPWVRLREDVGRLLSRVLDAVKGPDSVSDEELRLIAQARHGGPEGRAAFDELVRLHQAWLVRVVFFLLGNDNDAQDVAQDAFARAFVNLHAFTDDRRGLRPWLRTLATRLAFNHRRDKGTRRRYEGEFASDAGERQVPGHRGEEEQAVLQALEGVSSLYREILVLYYLEDRSVAEIAEVLAIGRSAAKMRLTRARAEFRQVYTRITQ